jgi:hypothetical protein
MPIACAIEVRVLRIAEDAGDVGELTHEAQTPGRPETTGLKW